VDDILAVTGSTNMDNVSFFYSSELSVTIFDEPLAQSLRVKLCAEHLQNYFVDGSFLSCFNSFKKIAQYNSETLKHGVLSGRPVAMAPAENYSFLLKIVYHTSNLTKLLTTVGINPYNLTPSNTWDFKPKQRKANL